MPVILEPNYALPIGAAPLSHARILHAGGEAAATPVASSTQAGGGFSPQAPLNALTYDRWMPAVVPATYDLTALSEGLVDCLAIAAHTMGAGDAAPSWIRVEGRARSALAPWVEIIPQQDVSSNDPIFIIFEPRDLGALRLEIGGDAPQIGIVRAGRMLQMQRRAIYGGHTPLRQARNVTMRSNRSVTGEFLGRSIQRGDLSCGFEWRNLTPGFARGAVAEFARATEEAPFFIAPYPDLHPEDVAYCWTEGRSTPAARNQGQGDLMAFSISARGYLND